MIFDNVKVVTDIWYSHIGGGKTFSKFTYAKNLTAQQKNEFYERFNDLMVERNKVFHDYIKTWTAPWNRCNGLEKLWGETINEMVEEYMRTHKAEMPGFSEIFYDYC